jgi:type VI secretion system protein ImpH
MADLIQRLAAQYADFDFFQAVTLLEEYFTATQGMSDPLASGAIRFEADDGISFPPNDIAGVMAEPDTVRLRLAFMGLVGTTSPLPNYFVEYAARRVEEGGALADFLAIFNHRVYTLFYRAWQKYRFLRAAVPAGFIDKIRLMAGQGPESGPESGRLCAYTGLFAGKSRSGQGLAIVIADFFDGIETEVRPWVPRWAPIPELRGLGRARLGVDTIIGTHVYDINGKFRVVIGPLPRAIFETFLPGTPNSMLLSRIIAAYCIDPLAFDVEVKLQSQELEPVILGAFSTALGKTSSLGRSAEKSGVESVVY